MKVIRGGVAKPLGFKANGLCCGIKKLGKLDLAVILSDAPCTAAAVFTKNSVKAAPLLVSKKNIMNNVIQAIVVNSGNANCFTGEDGLNAAKNTAIIYGEALNIKSNDIIVSSTGIIGKKFPFSKIQNFAGELASSLKKTGSDNVSKAILTTDLTTKQKCVEIDLNGKKVTIAGCAKGSGMIAPNMATMLCFITTDADIDSKVLNLALKNAVADTFNCITIDGCMSTNDMVTIMANGFAENKKICKEESREFKKFYDALHFICLDLAKKIVLDGEGATKFITINVDGAKTSKQAKDIAMVIANSALVKTAAYGSNPNWGRVAAAVGSMGIKNINENNLDISFSPFTKKEIEINVVLKLGKSKSTVYTSDLSIEYIKINGRYN